MVRIHRAVAASLLATGLTLTPLATPPATASSGCADIWFLGARGSGESASGHHGMGPAVEHMGQVVHDAALAKGLTATWLAINFSADSVKDDLRPTARQLALFLVDTVAALLDYKTHNVDKYLASIADGISETVSDVHTVLAMCPDAQIVLAGYSQGAIAVHDAENRMVNKADLSVTHVVGTLLLGDGDRTPQSQARLFGSSPKGGEGLRPWLRLVKKHDVPFPESTAEICNAEDVVCDFSKDVFRHPSHAVNVHTSYANYSNGAWHYDPILGDAARWIGKRLQPSVLKLVNDARAASRWCGQVQYPAAPQLVHDPRLDSAAMKYAALMAHQNFFSHIGPDGSTPTDRAAAEGFPNHVQEAIAAGFTTNRAVVNTWLNSPGHCMVLMTSADLVGIGYAYDKDSEYKSYWVLDGQCPCADQTATSQRRMEKP